MDDRFEDARGARDVGAIRHHFVLRVLDLRATAWAPFRHLVPLFGAGPPVLHRPQDLRDDLAGARHLDPIASRMSFAAISSALCSVALDTVTPPISTGSSTAYGFRAPVRPTLMRISSSLVICTSGANLRAIDQRGSRLPIVPSSA